MRVRLASSRDAHSDIVSHSEERTYVVAEMRKLITRSNQWERSGFEV